MPKQAVAPLAGPAVKRDTFGITFDFLLLGIGGESPARRAISDDKCRSLFAACTTKSTTGSWLGLLISQGTTRSRMVQATHYYGLHRR